MSALLMIMLMLGGAMAGTSFGSAEAEAQDTPASEADEENNETGAEGDLLSDTGSDIVEDDAAGPETNALVKNDSAEEAPGQLAGDETRDGTDGDEEIWLDGNGNLVNGGAGNDTLMVASGAHVLEGGAGDDVLDATLSAGYDKQVGTLRLSDILNPAGSLLDGGEGDDRLFGSFNDTLTGGAGHDSFSVAFDPDAEAALDGAAVVTDFQPGQDQIALAYDAFDPNTMDAPATELRDELTLRETDGTTEVIGRNGEVVLRLEGATGLVVALQIGADFDSFTTFDGAPIDPARADIVITRFHDVTT